MSSLGGADHAADSTIAMPDLDFTIQLVGITPLVDSRAPPTHHQAY